MIGTITAANVVGPAAQGYNVGDSPGGARIKAGVTYANMHTPMFPAGEIRLGRPDPRARGDNGDK